MRRSTSLSACLPPGESDGVIGRLARATLQRLPSNIYWSGLRRLGICLFAGSQDTYHQSLDRFYRSSKNVVVNDDGELVKRASRRTGTYPCQSRLTNFPRTRSSRLRMTRRSISGNGSCTGRLGHCSSIWLQKRNRMRENLFSSPAAPAVCGALGAGSRPA